MGAVVLGHFGDKFGRRSTLVLALLLMGFLLATAVIALTTLATTDEQMAAWGWRIPFLTSAIMVGIGLYIRIKLEESDALKELQEKADTEAKSAQDVPFIAMLRSCPVQVLKSILVPMGVQAGYYMTTVFLLFIFVAGFWSDNAPRSVPMSVGLGLKSSRQTLWAREKFGHDTRTCRRHARPGRRGVGAGGPEAGRWPPDQVVTRGADQNAVVRFQ
ncbi:hypothetical protein [Rhodococcus sp. T7]|uniref:hypothetical protein n=1 Tax=Rhodococcus sp. T7 TaxID=627444 RepID=UPI00135788EF|nr:hypothetical protein [Rhodococcus sp. T7]